MRDVVAMQRVRICGLLQRSARLDEAHRALDEQCKRKHHALTEHAVQWSRNHRCEELTALCAGGNDAVDTMGLVLRVQMRHANPERGHYERRAC
jgi:hypothetical protein